MSLYAESGSQTSHSVHVEAGGLEAARPYWYRFHAGDATSPIGRTRTRGKASGVETDTPLALVTEIRNGKTISIQAYLDPRQALEAVGLSEQDAHADS